MAKYNRRVKPQSFEKGDLVLRIGNKNPKDRKLIVNWEGPCWVKEKLNKGAYVLEMLEKKLIKRTRNADKLKVYYS